MTDPAVAWAGLVLLGVWSLAATLGWSAAARRAAFAEAAVTARASRLAVLLAKAYAAGLARREHEASPAAALAGVDAALAARLEAARAAGKPDSPRALALRRRRGRLVNLRA